MLQVRSTMHVGALDTWMPCSSFEPSTSICLLHPIQLVVQRLQADAEHLGGAGLVVARGLERGEISFCSASSTVMPGAIVTPLPAPVPCVRGGGAEARQVLRLDELAARQNRGALDDVAQLAHVARPVVELEHPHRLGRDRLDVASVARVELVEERLDDERQIVLAIAQRRQLDREDVEPVVEIVAQLAVADRVERIDVGRREHADVDFLLDAAAQPPERRSCSTRSSLTCVTGTISAISSRNSVPRSASSKQPARRSMAPVNAPRSWPKISLSSSVSGIAAQLMATNGASARGLSWWMVCATSSLPVPDSPMISTDAGVGAACSMTW